MTTTTTKKDESIKFKKPMAKLRDINRAVNCIETSTNSIKGHRHHIISNYNAERIKTASCE